MIKDETNTLNHLNAVCTVINTINKELKINHKCLAVTSYIPQQGKSRIIQLVAEALSKSGYKTLLIDANIRAPYLSHMAMIEGAQGLLDFVSMLKEREIKYREIMPYIKKIDEENLYFLPCFEQLNESYTQYIKKEDVQYIFSILKERFDVILVETPSFKALSYTQSILEACDGYFMIIKKGKLLKKDAFLINKNIQQVQGNLIGAILNKAQRL